MSQDGDYYLRIIGKYKQKMGLYRGVEKPNENKAIFSVFFKKYRDLLSLCVFFPQVRAAFPGQTLRFLAAPVVDFGMVAGG